MELNALGRHIFGYDEENIKSWTRSANTTTVAEIMSVCVKLYRKTLLSV